LLGHVQSREAVLTAMEQGQLKAWFDVHSTGKPKPASAHWALIAWDK